MGENPSDYKGADHPVECVSWDDCQAFLEKLNAHPAARASGLVFRLPTEEEWETACRAGSTNDYCRLADGTEITEATLGRVAWYDDNASTRPRWLARFLAFAEGLVDRVREVDWGETVSHKPVGCRSRTRGGFTICTAMCGSGPKRRMARTASAAVAAVTTRPGAASPPTGAGARPPTGTPTSASASAPRSAPPRKKLTQRAKSLNLTQRAQRAQSLAPPLGELASEARLRGFRTQRTQRAQSPDNVHQLPMPPVSTNANSNPNPRPARLSRPLPLSLLTLTIVGH